GLWASYSYVKPDTTVLMVDLGSSHKFRDRFQYNGLLSLDNGDDDLLLTDSHGDLGTTPTLSIYLQQSLRNNQMLIASFNGQFYFGKTYSDYVETLAATPSSSPLTDIHTDIRDRNQGYGLETDYIKNWNNARFTAGISYNANRNRSDYQSLGGQVFHQRQDRVYFFAEYYRRFGKFTATAGMGAQFTDFKFRESGQGNHSWSPRPQATITYSINQNHNFRLNFSSWQSNPSLAETNIVPQQLDSFQWRVGNPDIKTASSYMLFFTYRFALPRVYATFGLRAFTSPDAITPLLYWDNDRLITTYENSKGLRHLSFILAPQIIIVPDWLMLSGYLQYRMERMAGTGYVRHHNCWSGNASLQLMHWGFTLEAQYRRAERDLWGEKISWGEDINIIELSYNWRDWQFGAGVIMPFGKYDQGSKSLSKWNRNEQHMRLKMRMPFISISYNVQWGRQKRSAQKLVDVETSADRSSAGGR
ncbi:MAG: outer membrane beta-barrel family protein, partial [Muribaculaceae bacterium]|nr:outer membrane beta-barrel family protein [Muribaculaceae bacterium]